MATSYSKIAGGILSGYLLILMGISPLVFASYRQLIIGWYGMIISAF
jgi:hypothetical protein